LKRVNVIYIMGPSTKIQLIKTNWSTEHKILQLYKLVKIGR